MSTTPERLGLKHPASRWEWGTNYRNGVQQVPIDPDESHTRPQMCNRCSSCAQTRFLTGYGTYLGERAPLLRGTSMPSLLNGASVPFYRTSRCVDLTLIYAFVAVLIFSTGIGIYLLVLESTGAMIEEFDYVSRENWGVNITYIKDLPSLHTPASKILLLNITSDCNITSQPCLSSQKYSDRPKEKNRLHKGEVLYNFYEDKNGKIFEGRGWSYQSVCERNEGCDDIFTIALLDANKGPSPLQTKKLKAFLDYCVMDDTLKSCYEILVSDISNRAFVDLAFNLDEMNRKDGTCQYYLS